MLPERKVEQTGWEVNSIETDRRLAGRHTIKFDSCYACFICYCYLHTFQSELTNYYYYYFYYYYLIPYQLYSQIKSITDTKDKFV